jgi:FSR family fosmidomycin resistance protein-like MFS transporter
MNKIKRLFFLSLGHSASDFYPGMLSPLLPVFIAQHDWSITKAGILVTVLQASCNFSQPVFGIINDHQPMRSFLWTGLIIGGLPFCFVLNIKSFSMMVLAMVISGLGVGLFHPVAAVAAGRIADTKRKSLSMALFSSGGHISFMIAPMIAVLIVKVLGNEYMPLIILPALVMAIYFAFDKNIVVNEGHGYSLNEWFSSFYMSSRELFLLWIVSSFRAIVLMLVGSFLPILAMARGASYAESAYFLSASLFASTTGMFIGGHLSDIYGRKKIMAIMMLAASPLLFGFLKTSGGISVMLLLMGMATLSSTIPVSITHAQLANPKLAGMASSLVMGLSFAMGALAATPFGILADHIGIESAMKVPTILPFFGGLAVFFMKRD